MDKETIKTALEYALEQLESALSLHRIGCLAAAILILLSSACADTERESKHADPSSQVGIHFLEEGSGEPVVLVHGFSQTHSIWLETPLYDDLVRDHRVIVVDLRGHGNSDKPRDPEAYGPNLQSDLMELLDHLGIDKAHFVGFSLGANVVGDALVLNPERVRTATLCSGFFTAWDEREEQLAELIEKRKNSDLRQPWEPEDQDYLALAALIRGARYSAVRPEQIASIVTPTLIVFGSIEVEHMTELQKRQLENVPGSMKTLIIAGADHDSPKAAILSPQFTHAVREIIASNPTK